MGSPEGDDAKALFRMGVSLFALQRFLDAEAAYFGAIRVRPPWAHIDLQGCAFCSVMTAGELEFETELFWLFSQITF